MCCSWTWGVGGRWGRGYPFSSFLRLLLNALISKKKFISVSSREFRCSIEFLYTCNLLSTHVHKDATCISLRFSHTSLPTPTFLGLQPEILAVPPFLSEPKVSVWEANTSPLGGPQTGQNRTISTVLFLAPGAKQEPTPSQPHHMLWCQLIPDADELYFFPSNWFHPSLKTICGSDAVGYAMQ